MRALSVATCLLTVSLAGAQDGAKPWELALRATRYAAVFNPGEEATIQAIVRNRTSEQKAATVSFEAKDVPLGPNAQPKVYTYGEVPVSVAKGTEAAVRLTLGSGKSLPQGEYLEVTVALACDGAEVARCVKGFGFLERRQPKAPSEESHFGLLAAMQWPFLQRLGARWDRPNWNWDERPMEWSRRYAVRTVALINEANQAFDRRMTMDEYTDFVRQSVSRYKRYVKYWQLGNEFDVFHRNGPQRFVEVQRAGYQAAKEADPECVVVGGSITDLHVRFDAWDECLSAGLAKWCDVYDFHFYADLATTQKTIDVIHAGIASHHAPKPIWCTETAGVPTTGGTERNKAGYIYKRYAHLLANDIQVVFWHVLWWPHFEGEAGKIAMTALVDWDNFAKMSVFTYATLTREVEGARFTRRWDCGEGVYAIEFARGGRAKLFLWTEGEPKPITIARPAGGGFRLLITGHREPLAGGTLTATSDPVILDVPGPVKAVG